MSRPARGRAIREALAQASRTPEGRREVLAALEEAGLTERQAAAAFQGANTVRRATAVQTVISEVTMRRLYTEVWNVISVPIGIAVSASPARLTGSGSGSVRTAMVYLHVVDPE